MTKLWQCFIHVAYSPSGTRLGCCYYSLFALTVDTKIEVLCFYVFKFHEVYPTVLTYNLWTFIRHKLQFKMKKPDQPIKKQKIFMPQHLAAHLANATNNEGLVDESSSLSKSLIGGSMNTCKMRVSSFIWNERVVQGLLQFLLNLLFLAIYSSFSCLTLTFFCRKCCDCSSQVSN
jgi:hypothetical protein